MPDKGLAAETSREARPPWAFGRRARSVSTALAGTFLAERARWPLWLPVMASAGIGAYFALPFEPAPWATALLGAAALLLAAFARRSPGGLPVALAFLAAVAGFGAAELRTWAVGGGPLTERLGPARTEGRVARVEILPGARRLLLEDVRRADLDDGETLGRVRLRTGASGPPPWPGDRVVVRAELSPPPPPVAPGAFDFQRHAFFRGIGAVGFARGPVRVIEPPDGQAAPSSGYGLERIRQKVYRRVLATVGGPEGAIAAALLTGERGAIPEDVLTAMRDSGLAHLLAISGLHVGLLAGLLFFGVRALLALVEPVALRFPIKKWAAVAALLGAFGYLLLTGAPVPTQRAFLMLALALVAVLLDRTAVSMRLVAWAAVVVLAASPESLLGASFQMSFAAVVALVAVYEATRERWAAWRREAGPWRTGMLYFAGVALTTIVASAATAPFAAFHFNRLAVYGLAANLVAVPVTGLWIMPWALAAMGLMPFGADEWALRAMAAGIELVVAVAREVSAWPGAVALVPAMSTAALCVIALGGLWLCLWRRRWRLLGVPAMALGVALAAWPGGVPDVLVSGSGRLMAVKDADGRLALSTRRVERFAGDVWLRRAGQRTAARWPREEGADGALACDGLGCIYRAGGLVVALENDAAARFDDCAVADVVVSAVPVRGPCPSARVIIDRFDLWRSGAHALWFENGSVRVETVRDRQGERPWVAGPVRRRRR